MTGRPVAGRDVHADSPRTGDVPLKPAKVQPETEKPAAKTFFEVPPFDLDSWEWDEDLRRANQLVQKWRGPDQNNSRGAAAGPHFGQSANSAPAARGVSPASARKRRPSRSRGHQLFTWLFLSTGVMALVFGGVLLGWSTFAIRPELWTIGLPFALGGQAALVLGLVLQLDGLWQKHDAATETLTELDEQLDELRRATTQLSTTHSSASQAFYSHLAEGCSPHMLLTDLKGQLDLLALCIADRQQN